MFFMVLLALSASSSPLTYKASLIPVQDNRTKATGLVSITIINSSAATGFFYATNIASITQAYLFSIDFTTKDTITVPLAYAFNATYGPVSGSIKVSFTFNPSVKNFSALIAKNSIGFVILTSARPNGELGAWLTSNQPTKSPSPPSARAAHDTFDNPLINGTEYLVDEEDTPAPTPDIDKCILLFLDVS